MVYIGLRMSTRFPIQKSAPLSYFPPHKLYNAKIKANSLPIIYKEGPRFLNTRSLATYTIVPSKDVGVTLLNLKGLYIVG